MKTQIHGFLSACLLSFILTFFLVATDIALTGGFALLA